MKWNSGVRALRIVASALAMLLLSGGVAQASGTLAWGSPAVVDHEPEFGVPFELPGISCPSSTFCAATADNGAATHPQGVVLVSTDPGGGWSTWQQIPIAAAGGLGGIACPSSSFCVATARAGNVAVSTAPTDGPNAWTIEHIDSAVHDNLPADLTGVSCPTASLCVAVDNAGDVVSSNHPDGGAGAWQTNGIETNGFSGVSCPSDSFCAAIDTAGDVWVTSDPTGGPSAWSRTFHHAGSLAAISCASESLCAVTDYGGDVITSTDPRGGANTWTTAQVDPSEIDGDPHNPPRPAVLQSISCPSASLCVAGDELGQVFSSQNPTGGASAWKRVSLSGGGDAVTFNDISCASTSTCVGVGTGSAYFSSNPNGDASAWVREPIAGANLLQAISCVPGQFCVTVDNSGHAVRLSGGSATAATVDPDAMIGFPTSVSCPAASLCVAVDIAGDILTSTDTGSSWTRTALPRGIESFLGSVACPTTSFCAAVDGWGYLVTSSNPTGGPSAWKTIRVDVSATSPRLAGITCPTQHFCAAVDDNGNVVSSTQPSGGARSWHRQLIHRGARLTDIACPSVHLCIAVGLRGAIYTSVNPTARRSAWSLTRPKGTAGFFAVSCPSSSFCLAAPELLGLYPSEDRVFVSTNPTGGPAAWAQESSPMPIADVSCLTASRCVAAGDESVANVSITPVSLLPGIKASLRGQLARHGGNRRFAAKAITAGRLKITWYRKHIVIASDIVTFNVAGTRTVTLRLTRPGERALRRGRTLHVTAVAAFTRPGGSTVSVKRPVAVRS